MSFWRKRRTDELYAALDEYSLPHVLILQETSSISILSFSSKFIFQIKH